MGEDNEVQTEFAVEISKHTDGGTSIQIILDIDDDEDSPVDPSDDDKADDGIEKRKTSPLKVSSTEKFRKLSDHWVQTSIAFFQVIPKLTDQNFRFAEAELSKELYEYAEKNAISKTLIEDDDTTVEKFTLSIEELPIISKTIGRSTQVIQAASTMSRSTLGALMSEYEAFLASVLRLAGESFPNAFISDTDVISVGELAEFDSIEQARTDLVAQKIDDLLHSSSHVKVLAAISEKFNVTLTKGNPLISEFTEICQRRHLLTHAGGVVNKRYLKICSEAGCDMNALPKLGERVYVNSKYIRKATAQVFQVGFFTLHILWQKLHRNDYEKSSQAILTASHDFLENNLTKMTRRLVDFGLNGPTSPPARHQAYLTVNKALSFLYDPTMDEEDISRNVEETLSKRDWTILSPTLELALACIRRDFQNLEKLAEAAALDGVDYFNANTWAVFREVRDRPEFISKFKRSS